MTIIPADIYYILFFISLVILIYSYLSVLLDCNIPDFDVQENEGNRYFPKLSFLENCANKPCKWKVKNIEDKYTNTESRSNQKKI